jgi:hypothetical protein
MRAGTRTEFVAGPAGKIECAVEFPAFEPHGVALVAHPHPLFGGTLDNKVAQTLARAFVELGYTVWRPNFRGVGESEGSHDEGRGELEDLAAVIEYLKSEKPVLAGFSFGAAIQARLAQRLVKEGNPASRMVLVGVAVKTLEVPPVPAGTIVIHGERDTTVLLADVLAWARPQDLPVVVVPGADHFFHRRLHVLRAIIQNSWK